jgi:integrase
MSLHGETPGMSPQNLDTEIGASEASPAGTLVSDHLCELKSAIVQPYLECRHYSATEPTIEVDRAKSLLSAPVTPGLQETGLDQFSHISPQQKARPIKGIPWDFTLADVMQRVASSPDLREARRRDVLSALRTLARCLGRPPELISAVPKSLQREMAAVNYHQAGLGKSRWINTKSLARKGLKVAGINIMPGRRANSAFSTAWAHLRTQCGPNHRMGLSRFMNHCSLIGIEPKDVDETVFGRFETELTTNSLELDSQKIYAQTRRIWDKAAETAPDWPAFRTGVTSKPRGYSRPWSAYPEAFLADVEAFLARGSAEHKELDLDDDFPMLRPATIKGRRISLRLIAHAVVESGYPIQDLTGLHNLVEPKNAKQIIQFFMRRNGGGANEGIYGYASLLRTIAKYWVKSDRQTREALDKYCKKTVTKQRGMTKKNRERLRQFEDPANVHAMYALPAKLMKMARAAEKDSEAAFCHATYAMAIETLLRAPVRIENLYSLNLEENIIMPSDARRGEVILTFPHYAVKNDQNFEHALPPEFGKMLREYMTEFRRGGAANSPWLFPTAEGKRRTKDSFAQQIKALIFRHTGITANVHIFRGLMVKMWLKAYPNDLETVSKMLGHTTTATTARAYSEGKTTAGQQAFSDIIDAKRLEVEHCHGRRRR